MYMYNAVNNITTCTCTKCMYMYMHYLRYNYNYMYMVVHVCTLVDNILVNSIRFFSKVCECSRAPPLVSNTRLIFFISLTNLSRKKISKMTKDNEILQDKIR